MGAVSAGAVVRVRRLLNTQVVRSPIGKRLPAQVTPHWPEIVRAVTTRPELALRAGRAVREAARIALQHEAGRGAAVDTAFVGAARRLIESFDAAASEPLRAWLIGLRADLDRAEGRPLREVLAAESNSPPRTASPR